jgi:hypothetical protein
MTKELPSREYIASLLEYEAGTGIFRWTKTRVGARAGKIAGTLDANGYLKIRIYGRFYMAHRLAWLFAYGHWPDGPIDHINRSPSDNRLPNLRACSAAENNRNTGARRDNTSGVKGVGWNRQKGAWRVRIKAAGKEVHGGFFKDIEDAKRAIRELRNQLHGDFANHG